MRIVFKQPGHIGSQSRTTSEPWLAAAALFVLLTFLAPAAVGQDARVDLDKIQEAFERVVERVTPSVVGVRVQRRYVTTLSAGDGAADTAFEQLVTVNGSGTIIDADGLILTNEHVIQAAAEIKVLFHDGTVAPADILSSDPRGDLAVLKVNRNGLTPVKWVDWSRVERGQWTIAIGNPYGLGGDGQLSVSVGVVSNLDRKLPGLGEADDRLYTDLIQTTAAIHPGCSGGPLFNIHGELIGIVAAMHTRAPADEGVGFAIPMSPSRRRAITQLSLGKPVEYGYVGLTVRSPAPDERLASGLGAGVGVVVEKVDPGGPAANAGILRGDLLLRYDGDLVRGPAALAELVGHTAAGTNVTVELRRDGKNIDGLIAVERRQVSRVSWMRGGAILWRGMRLANLTPHTRGRMGVSDGAVGVVVIDIATASAAQRAGVRIGDVIERVADRPVRDITHFNAGVRGRKEAVKMTVRGRGEVFVGP